MYYRHLMCFRQLSTRPSMVVMQKSDTCSGDSSGRTFGFNVSLLQPLVWLKHLGGCCLVFCALSGKEQCKLSHGFCDTYCIYVCLSLCVCVFMYICHLYTCIYVCVCMHVCTYVCVFTCMYVCMLYCV